MKKIAIIDYGLGNTYSIQNALAHFGASSDLVADADKILNYSHVVLPGVGAFPYAMERLKSKCMDEALINFVRKGRPLFGICLGMQLLFTESNEYKITKGLGLLTGRVERFESKDGYSIPQTQWNKITLSGKSQMTNNIDSSDYFYFLHSYCVKEIHNNAGMIIGLTTYAKQDYVSLIQQENILGVQFHPEKSGESGLKLLKNFIRF